MGDQPSAPVIVADAGPLLHLHWVGASDWALPQDSVQVVDAVWIEVARHAPSALLFPRLTRTADPAPHAALPAGVALDAGELSAISYALSVHDRSCSAMNGWPAAYARASASGSPARSV